MTTNNIRTISTLVLVMLLTTITTRVASGQEMEPRAYSPAPVGSQFVVFTYGYQSVTARIGGNLNTIAIGWQYAWF